MVIRELTYQLHKLEASESALVSADHHDKKSVLGIGGKNPDRSIPNGNVIKGKKLHIPELVFNLCPVNFENTTAKSYIIFLSNEVITVFVIKPTSLFAMLHNHSACT